MNFLQKLTINRGMPLIFILFILLFTVYLFLSSLSQTSHRPETNVIVKSNKLCASTSTKTNKTSVAIIVLSARKNFINRNLIRQTWGAVRSIYNIKILAVVFMLGNSDAPGEKKTDLKELEAESEQFDDLVIGEFVDTYRNLTRKTIMAYEWLTSFCRNAQIVVKTDDDVMVNIFRVTEELSGWSNEIMSSNIWCGIHFNEKYITNPQSRFYVPPDYFPGDVFPTHCAGVGYITPIRVIERIAEEISRSFVGRVSTHEDVFMTGVVPQKINAQIAQNSNFSSQQENTINLINKRIDWITYTLENENGPDAQFLLKLLEHPTHDAKTVDEFLKRFGKQMFYLLNHSKDFSKKYLRLWEIIEQIVTK